jgi:hypothetical protein
MVAERLLVAEKANIQIAVEVKRFVSTSVVYKFHQAIGQYLPVMHLDLIDGKIWIQENRTDADIGQFLIEAGVERQDIVLVIMQLVKRSQPSFSGLNGFRSAIAP